MLHVHVQVVQGHGQINDNEVFVTSFNEYLWNGIFVVGYSPMLTTDTILKTMQIWMRFLSLDDIYYRRPWWCDVIIFLYWKLVLHLLQK